MEMKPVFKKVLQVGLVVKNVDEAVKKYEQFGIGPWKIREYGSSNLKNLTLRGKPVDFSIRAAFAKIGEVELELIEPLDDNSAYAEFMKQHGEGLHHLALDVDGFEKTLSIFENKGVGVLQSGSGFAYLDSEKALSFIAEIYDRP